MSTFGNKLRSSKLSRIISNFMNRKIKVDNVELFSRKKYSQELINESKKKHVTKCKKRKL